MNEKEKDLKRFYEELTQIDEWIKEDEETLEKLKRDQEFLKTLNKTKQIKQKIKENDFEILVTEDSIETRKTRIVYVNLQISKIFLESTIKELNRTMLYVPEDSEKYELLASVKKLLSDILK